MRTFSVITELNTEQLIGMLIVAGNTQALAEFVVNQLCDTETKLENVYYTLNNQPTVKPVETPVAPRPITVKTTTKKQYPNAPSNHGPSQNYLRTLPNLLRIRRSQHTDSIPFDIVSLKEANWSKNVAIVTAINGVKFYVKYRRNEKNEKFLVIAQPPQ